MRILHLVHRAWPYHGGAERYVLEHAAAASRWGHRSTVLTTDAWDMSWMVRRRGRHLETGEILWRNVPIRRFPVRHPPLQSLLRAILRRIAPGGPDRFYYPNPFVPSLQRFLRRDQGFDLVHANAMPFLLYMGWRYARRFGCGLASVPHANLGERYRRTSEIDYFAGDQRKVLRQSSLVVAQSRFEADVFHKMGVDSERVLVLGSGIDPAELNAHSERRENLGLRPPVVLGMTAQCIQKGSENLLRAALSLWKKGVDFTLVLAGPVLPDFAAALEKTGCEAPEGRLVVTGYVRQEERASIIASADVVALPSRLDCFGIILLEAWFLGKPVVGCWSGAMPDLITDGENGFLVPFGDHVTLAHRLRLLMDDPGKGREMGEKGSRLVRSEYTWKRRTDVFYSRLACLGDRVR